MYSKTNAATIAAMTAITGFAAITPNRAVKAPFTFPSMLVIVVSVFIFENSPVIADIPVATFPIIMSSGPIAATINAMVATIFFCPSLIPFNFFTKSWITETAFLIYGIKISPNAIASSCRALCKAVICPDRLSCMVSAMFSAAPSQLSIFFISFW